MIEKTLYVVGIGPGKDDLLTLRAKKVLSSADVVLGHKTYVKRIANLVKGELIESKMGKELERVKIAIKLTKKGKKVCLVSGGDPTIYGMASLVFEYLIRNNIDIRMEVIPGVTALSAASPLLGCPVSGDHCVISLSDLLTPWEAIERRLISALLGDFVIVIYNPSSRRRKKNLVKAMQLVFKLRGDIPVGCVKNAERDKTEVWVTTPLNIIDSPDKIDMHTILFVSSYETEVVKSEKELKILTPRGYSKKYSLLDTVYPLKCKMDNVSIDNVESIDYKLESKLMMSTGAKTEEGIKIAKSSAELTKSILAYMNHVGSNMDNVEKFIVERCIVATADLSLFGLLKFNRTKEVVKAIKDCKRIIVDVEMVKAGILSRLDLLNEEKEVIVAHKVASNICSETKTVVASGIRKLADRISEQVIAIGNAPSALQEVCKLIDEGIKPSAVIATPVGFTNASKSKHELMKKDLPWIVVSGVRGGSTLCVAILNALLSFSFF